jgi:uncharacterized protein (TIGR02217 family)
MAFDDVRFPVAIARGQSGGPQRRTDVVVTASGREERNARWAHSRRKYNVGYGIRTIADLNTVIAFFEERRGRLHGFRFKDHVDFKSCAANAAITSTDQVIGSGTGLLADFQLVKRYGAGPRAYDRTIFAPVAGSILIAVNSVPTTDFTVNLLTGMVSFQPGFTPPAGATITAGFEFDVPVRFDADEITINLAHFEAGEIPEIALLEIKP